MSAAEAGSRLGVSQRQVYRLLHEGRLPGRRVGAAWLVPSEAVRERARSKPHAGRPLSAPMAWSVLRVADEVLRESLLDSLDAEDSERFAALVSRSAANKGSRHRLRALLASAPPVDRWDQWLARRAEPHRLWLHPGSLADLRSDARLRPAGAAAAGAAGLLGDVGDLDRFYVDASDYEAVVADHRAQPAFDGQVVLSVVPAEVEPELAPPLGEPVGPAVALVDLLSSAHAREAALARRHLSHVSKVLAEASRK